MRLGGVFTGPSPGWSLPWVGRHAAGREHHRAGGRAAGADAGAPSEAWCSVYRQSTLGPFLIFPLVVGVDGSVGRSHNPQGKREPGLQRAGRGGDSDSSLPRTTGRCPALSCRGDARSGEEGEGCHTGTRETRYLSGSTERVQEEELKRQQNRNRNSEEGLQSGGEGKERLGDGSRPN